MEKLSSMPPRILALKTQVTVRRQVWFGKQSALSFEEYAYSYMKAGASAVGGCCTTVAKHVEEVVRAKEETYKCNRHIYIYI